MKDAVMRFKCLHGLAPAHLMFTLSILYTETSWIYRDSEQLPVSDHLCIEPIGYGIILSRTLTDVNNLINFKDVLKSRACEHFIVS